MIALFIVFALPLLGLGLAAALKPAAAGLALKHFARSKTAAAVLTALAWFFTAYELDNIGIEAFDRYLKAFPGELWILAAVLTPLTCWWMANLLPIRALCGVFMLIPAEVFPLLRMEPSVLRIEIVLLMYAIAVFGMFGMFYPWHIRRLFWWFADEAKPARLATAGWIFAATGAAFLVSAAAGAFA